MKTRTKFAVGALAALPTLGIASPAHAAIDGHMRPGEIRYTVAPSPQWETLANLPMRQIVRIAGYGWRAGFCVRGGNRYDAATYLGRPGGAVEGRALAFADGPNGPCTLPVNAAQLSVRVAPIWIDDTGQRHALDVQGCNARAQTMYAQWGVVAQASGYQCSPMTNPGPYSTWATGGYTVTTVVEGQAFGDQPTSKFRIEWTNEPNRRI